MRIWIFLFLFALGCEVEGYEGITKQEAGHWYKRPYSWDPVTEVCWLGVASGTVLIPCDQLEKRDAWGTLMEREGLE